MRILLVGANGQLARDLARHLTQHTLTPVTHQELEIRDRHSVERVVSESEPDFIINTAAYHRVDDCEDFPELAMGVNAIGAYNLARTAQSNKATLVHFSTDYVFDGRKGSPYTEADRPNPLSVYGLSKWTGEKLIEQYCERHFIIRTCGLYGLGGSTSKGGNFVRTVLRAAASEKPLRVVADQIVTPTSTAELANKVAQLLEHNVYGIYHMTNTGECSWFEFASQILRSAGIAAQIEPVTTREFGSKARRPAYSVLDNARIRALGMREFSPWREALEEFMRMERQGLGSAA